MEESKEEILSQLSYAWNEWGDLERHSDYERMRASGFFPEIFQAWDNYKFASKSLTALIKNAYE